MYYVYSSTSLALGMPDVRSNWDSLVEMSHPQGSGAQERSSLHYIYLVRSHLALGW